MLDDKGIFFFQRAVHAPVLGKDRVSSWEIYVIVLKIEQAYRGTVAKFLLEVDLCSKLSVAAVAL